MATKGTNAVLIMYKNATAPQDSGYLPEQDPSCPGAVFVVGKGHEPLT